MAGWTAIQPAIRKVNEMPANTTRAGASAQPSRLYTSLDQHTKLTPFGIPFNETKLGAIAALDQLLSVKDDLSFGRVVAARVGITETISAIENSGRADFEIGLELIDLPPLWKIDAALHRRREKALQHYLPDGRMGEDRIYRESNVEIDREFLVHPNDVWVASTGTPGWRIVGSGLTSLIAYLKGQSIDAVAFEMAKRLNIGGGL